MEGGALEDEADHDGHHDAREIECAHHQHLMAGEERAGEERVDGHLGPAAHEGRQEDGEAPVALVVHAAGAHHGGHRAAEAHHHRDEGPSVEAELSKRLIHEERRAGHIAAVLQNGQEQEQKQNRGQERKHASHARERAVHQKAAHPAGHAPVRQRRRQRVHPLLHQRGKPVRQPCADRAEGDVEHQQHHEQKHRNRQQRMREHPVQPVGEGGAFLPCARVAGGEQLFDEAVARIGHHRRALHAHLPLHGGEDLLDDVARVLAQVQLLHHGRVALEELGRRVARGHAVRLRRLLHQMLDRVQRLVRRPGADIQLRRETVVLRRVHRAAHQLVQALALARADRHHRHAQPLLHGRQVDDVAVAAHLVHHVEGYHHRPPQLEQLKGQVEVAFKVGGVHDVDDHVGLLLDDEVAADDFLHRIGAEGIDARQIHDGYVRILIRHRLPVFVRAPEAPRQAQVGLLAVMMVQHRAGLFFDRHAGPVAHVLAAAGELVEEGGFAAVLVTGQGKGVMHSMSRSFL